MPLPIASLLGGLSRKRRRALRPTNRHSRSIPPQAGLFCEGNGVRRRRSVLDGVLLVLQLLDLRGIEAFDVVLVERGNHDRDDQGDNEADRQKHQVRAGLVAGRRARRPFAARRANPSADRCPAMAVPSRSRAAASPRAALSPTRLNCSTSAGTRSVTAPSGSRCCRLFPPAAAHRALIWTLPVGGSCVDHRLCAPQHARP